jgi:hypothetical protein
MLCVCDLECGAKRDFCVNGDESLQRCVKAERNAATLTMSRKTSVTPVSPCVKSLFF